MASNLVAKVFGAGDWANLGDWRTTLAFRQRHVGDGARRGAQPPALEKAEFTEKECAAQNMEHIPKDPKSSLKHPANSIWV